MRYSFVICTYQNKELLKNSLQALNNQEGFGCKDYEVIVVDDGSTGDTYSYINGINKNYTLRYIYLERNAFSCLSRARNKGLQMARGEYIIFIDADIIVKPNYLYELERFYKIKKDVAVIGTRLMIRESINFDEVLNESVFQKHCLNSNKQENLDFRHMIFNDLSYNCAAIKYPFIYALTCNLAVPKCYLDLIGGFNEELIYWGMDDIEMAYRLHKLNVKFVINGNIEVLHQQHGNHGLFVEEDKIQGLNKNVEVFLRNHPDAFPTLSREQVFELFISIATRYKMVEDKNTRKKKLVFKLEEYNDADKIINEIKSMPNIEDMDIEVIDYLERTDIDIRLQLIDDRVNVPKYYPVSKLLTSCQYSW